MNKDKLIDQTVKKIHQLPERKLRKVSDFVDYLLQKKEEEKLTNQVSYLNSESKAFDFLREEEELYDDSDLIS